MFWPKVKLRLQTDRLILRLPDQHDYTAWSELRRHSAEFLIPWEPSWSPEHLTRKGFANRVYWAQKSVRDGTAHPLFIERREDGALIGAITLDNIRRGPAQAATVGYWIGEPFARQGYMQEAIEAVVYDAFYRLELSRVEAATLPENKASRALLEKSGFKYEGVAQSYLQINGRWRTHVLFAQLRTDRRGKTDVG